MPCSTSSGPGLAHAPPAEQRPAHDVAGTTTRIPSVTPGPEICTSPFAAYRLGWTRSPAAIECSLRPNNPVQLKCHSCTMRPALIQIRFNTA